MMNLSLSFSLFCSALHQNGLLWWLISPFVCETEFSVFYYLMKLQCGVRQFYRIKDFLTHFTFYCWSFSPFFRTRLLLCDSSFFFFSLFCRHKRKMAIYIVYMNIAENEQASSSSGGGDVTMTMERCEGK